MSNLFTPAGYRGLGTEFSRQTTTPLSTVPFVFKGNNLVPNQDLLVDLRDLKGHGFSSLSLKSYLINFSLGEEDNEDLSSLSLHFYTILDGSFSGSKEKELITYGYESYHLFKGESNSCSCQKFTVENSVSYYAKRSLNEFDSLAIPLDGILKITLKNIQSVSYFQLYGELSSNLIEIDIV